VRAALLVLFVACAAPRPSRLDDAPEPRPTLEVRYYTIWVGGARIGSAREVERRTARGVTLERTEALTFLRGDAEVALSTLVTIHADRALVPRHVTWSETTRDDRRAGEARRVEAGWAVALEGGNPPRVPVPDDAVPAELVPLLVRRDGAFEGTVFLPARGFVAGRARVERVAPTRAVARFALAGGGAAEATVELDADGTPARVVDGDGVIALRATEAHAQAAFTPVDLLAATAIPIGGASRSGAAQLVVDGATLVPPLPGQRVRVAATGVEVTLDAAIAGELPAGDPGPDRLAEIARLVAEVHARIAPDLGRGPAAGRDPGATAGDCTTFALAYTALAAAHAIPTSVVTGLRVEPAEGRLVRHRWAVSWTGRRWIAVDAAYGAVPAGGDLVGLALHDADDAGLIAGEAALAQVRAATWR
jgi:hypothetical protein